MYLRITAYNDEEEKMDTEVRHDLESARQAAKDFRARKNPFFVQITDAKGNVVAHYDRLKTR